MVLSEAYVALYRASEDREKARGYLEQALSVLRDAEKVNPRYSALFAQRGLVYALLGQPEKAEEAFKKALALEESPGVRAALAELYLSMGRLDEALAQYAKALEQAPKDLDLRVRYASALLLKGKAEEAAKVLEEGHRLKPLDAEAGTPWARPTSPWGGPRRRGWPWKTPSPSLPCASPPPTTTWGRSTWPRGLPEGEKPPHGGGAPRAQAGGVPLRALPGQREAGGQRRGPLPVPGGPEAQAGLQGGGGGSEAALSPTPGLGEQGGGAYGVSRSLWARVKVPMWRFERGTFTPEDFPLPEEGSLLLVVNGRPWTVLAYTPGEEVYLAVGHLFLSGVLRGLEGVRLRVEEGMVLLDLPYEPRRPWRCGTAAVPPASATGSPGFPPFLPLPWTPSFPSGFWPPFGRRPRPTGGAGASTGLPFLTWKGGFFT